MGKKIVITRAHHQAQAFAAAIVNRLSGISMNDFVFEPMTEILHFPFNAARFSEYDGIIMTSMNAAVSLGLNAPSKKVFADKPFYCVGAHTKQKILSVGAQDVAINTPVAAQLAEEMLKAQGGMLCKDKTFLYMRGRDVAFDMKKGLMEDKKSEALGVQVDEVVCYEARAVERFSPNIVDAMVPGEIGMFTFFSKRTADVFVRLWGEEMEKGSGYEEQIKGVKALCISQDVAEIVHETFGKSACIVAKTPSMSGMIDKIEEGLK